MARGRQSERGATLIESVLVAIPMIFVLISTFEIARGMWIYQTMAHALKEAVRYASVHGNGCALTGNTCGITVSQVAGRIQSAGSGLVPTDLSLNFTDSGGTVSCALSDCLTNTTAWPTTAGGATGSDLTITGRYQFRSALAMFWPTTGGSVSFGVVNFPASARDTVQF